MLSFKYFVFVIVLMESVARLPSGISGLDDLIEGGIPKDSVVLVSGTAGSGKTLFCMQLLLSACSRGEKALYVSFEQPIRHIISQSKRFNWPIDRYLADGTLSIRYFDILAEQNVSDQIRQEVEEKKISVLVIDSLTALQDYPVMLYEAERQASKVLKGRTISEMHEESIRRILTHSFIQSIRNLNVTGFVITDPLADSNKLSSDGVSEFLCDGIFLLFYLNIANDDNRNFEVRKMRWTRHRKGTLSLSLSEKGFSIIEQENQMNFK